MIWPQAGAAAGGVKGVGLELMTVVVLSRGRHVDHAESVIKVLSWIFSGTLVLK